MFSSKPSAKIYLHFPVWGEKWEEAYMNTAGEMDFIRQGQRSFSNSGSYLIGGGTNAPRGDFFEYSDYVPRPFSGKKLSDFLSSVY